jgi:hypothetical protein
MVIMLSLLVACSTQDKDTSAILTEDLIENEEEECVNDEDFFAQEVWGNALSPVCYSCHNSQGAAAESDLVLVSNALPNYLQINRENLSYVASLQIDDESLVLRKPLGLDGHGGGAVITEDSDAFISLLGFVERLETPIEECAGEEDISGPETQLILATPSISLRKITMNLMGVLPSADHQRRVQNGGESVLIEVVEEVLSGVDQGYAENTKQLISDQLVQIWNDQLLTDRYLEGGTAINGSDYDRYPNLYYYQTWDEQYYSTAVRNLVNDSIAREPLELMRYVFLEDRPWSEILTADYAMINDWSAFAYSLGSSPTYGDEQHETFYPIQLSTVPTVGILTSAAFLNRYPTTDTNRNRHRSKVIFDYFLNTDVLALADRPIDATNSAIHNPTLNDPQCNVCHSLIDPVAGAFQNWDDDGHYNPRDEGWYPEMFAPGFEEEAIAVNESAEALRWLAEIIVLDRRFARSAVNSVFEGITGFPLLRGYEEETGSIRYESWEMQEAFLEEVTNKFEAGELDLKIVIREIVLSKYFRAVDHTEASESELLFAGTARLLTPEELDKRILATTGVQWGTNLSDRYRLLYGGIDSNGVSVRLTEPNGVIAAVGSRMANNVSCLAVAPDFVVPKEQRRLFPYVEKTYQPYTDDGFDVPMVQENIRLNIQHLFLRILGQDLTLDDPEIEIAYQLWLDLYEEGKGLVEDGTESQYLQYTCRSVWDPITREVLPSELNYYHDQYYTMRAWRGVLTYLLADYHFLVE